MHRLSAVFLCLMLMLSLGLGSVAHATEGATCIDERSAGSIDHSTGDADAVTGDADKGYPHHHGNCHGHHVSVPIGADAVAFISARRMPPAWWSNHPMAPAPSDAALRPPRA